MTAAKIVKHRHVRETAAGVTATRTISPMTADTLFDLPGAPKPRPRSEDYETWIAAVRPAFERAAATGREFTTYEIADRHRLPEPPDPAHHWGRLMTLLQNDGLIAKAGWACSSRPTTHASGVRTWRGTRASQQGWAA